MRDTSPAERRVSAKLALAAPTVQRSGYSRCGHSALTARSGIEFESGVMTARYHTERRTRRSLEKKSSTKADISRFANELCKVFYTATTLYLFWSGDVASGSYPALPVTCHDVRRWATGYESGNDETRFETGVSLRCMTVCRRGYGTS